MRELIPSFANILRRCHSPVSPLMKSCAPVSGFDRPSGARQAIRSSRGTKRSTSAVPRQLERDGRLAWIYTIRARMKRAA
jgi:hypothetical protein